MDRRSVDSPQALAAIEVARKLLNLAYDKRASTPEREVALQKAKAKLAPFGLTVEDLKEQSTPDYLTKPVPQQTGGYNQRNANNMAKMLRRGGWKGIDPATEAYKTPKGGEDV